jgi:glycerol-3-phosphate O-acyltransferase
MYLEINDKTNLKEIQETFADYYPYLKIEFFRRAHNKYEASPEEERVEPGTVIGDLKRTHVSGVLEIQPLYRVADVEREFIDRFGLSVQIFRKEKDHWEQTTGMDDFTLKDLNEFGRSSSDELVVSEYEEKFEDIEEKPEKLL